MNNVLKNILTGILIFLAISIIVCIILISVLGSSSNIIDKELKKEEQKIELNKNKLKLADIKKDGEFITGIFRNTLKEDIKYICITATTYDDKKNKINDYISNTTNLKPNQSWKFKIWICEKYHKCNVKITDLNFN
ncbi:MAG: FxLYD domain-containing protein [Syntrophothermus sp.]